MEHPSVARRASAAEMANKRGWNEMHTDLHLAELLKRKPDTFAHHLENPGVHADTYTRQKRLDLGVWLTSKRRIYLDTNHWLHLRDVLLGRSRNAVHAEIYRLLTQCVVSGRAVCPISYSVFHELLRQNDPFTRRATADVIDRFSCACSSQPPHQLTLIEVRHWLYGLVAPTRELYPLTQLAWTKAAFVLGDVSLNVTAL